MLTREQMEAQWDASHLPRLNCAGCRKCCEGDTIKLQPWEMAEHKRWKTEVVEGRRQLRKRRDGNCIYLGPRGCTIQKRKPFVCRIYDCRIAAELGRSPDHPATAHGRELAGTAR